MSDEADNKERDAQEKTGEEINKAYDEVEQTTKEDLGGNQTDADVEGFKDEILDELDQLKQELAKPDYLAADRRIRRLKKRLEKAPKDKKHHYGKNNARKKKIEDALDQIRKIKNKSLWTLVAVNAVQPISITGPLEPFNDAGTSITAISNINIGNIKGLSRKDRVMLESSGITKLGDLFTIIPSKSTKSNII